jgi:hypothetical protein
MWRLILKLFLTSSLCFKRTFDDLMQIPLSAFKKVFIFIFEGVSGSGIDISRGTKHLQNVADVSLFSS